MNTTDPFLSPEPLSICVRPLQIPELAAVLTETLARLSPARLSIVSDQLRAILNSDRPTDLIVRFAAQDDVSLDRGVVAIAALPEQGDTATILHVDWTKPSEWAASVRVNESLTIAERSADGLREKLLALFATHQIKFVQWATDPVSQAENMIDIPWWPRHMGFAQVGTLDYLAIDADESTGNFGGTVSEPVPPITLETVAQADAAQRERFERLVTETYRGSLDCPSLESYRTTDEIIQSYRCVSSYAPDLWFTVHVDDSEPVGCFMLARHRNSQNDELVLELVYMGVVPQHRGHGLGRRIMDQIARIGHDQNAVRLVLAVDRDNHPAQDAYRRFGMKPLFQETVWAASI
ncbi:GNAT family N-acetyltransferase [Neorhodopirellula pilleata]|uniref:GNAT family N-acetyltransferase n=1 Tax=Neorhodopirellula pilleata TaxID=2714738 RepID=UPI0011B5F9C7|nr:GNAT family N-acetyltransferase [Neorhodopirellula pilleata]